MRILTGLFSLVLIAVGSDLLWAQDPPPTEQLDDRFDATNYYADQQKAAWNNNAAKLTVIDEAYRLALDELGQENAQRLQAILDRNSAAHKSLADQELSIAERSTESQRIQADTARERAELSEWLVASRKEISVEHVAKRAAQFAATSALLDQLGEERIATLQKLLNGPVPLSSLPIMNLPDASGGTPTAATTGGTEDVSSGPAGGGVAGASSGAASGGASAGTPGGIDVSGTVPTTNVGDAVVASHNAERYALFERLFDEEKSRRERAEEEAASRQSFILTARAEANTIASRRTQRQRRTAEECERWPDADGDGAWAVECGGDDCDDTDPDRYPGNFEIGNAVDEDCDLTTISHQDEDGDGFHPAEHCNGDMCGQDCDDTKSYVHPGAREVCNFIDDNCSSRVDDNGVSVTKFLDRDGDLHGDPDYVLTVCPQVFQNPYGEGEWLSPIGNDCDDTDPNTWNGCAQQ